MNLVSVIIPTFNRAHLIGETLESLIGQSYPNWECIVVDDGSTDYTNELLEFYYQGDSRIKFYHRPTHLPKGANACRNHGFELSKGEFIHWFDSDDIMAKDNLKEKVDFLIANDSCDFCVSKIAKFDGGCKKGELIHSDTDLKIVSSLYEDYITGKISILNVVPLWRRKVFNPDDLYDENVYQFQDLDLYSRIIYKNNNVGIINKPLIFVRRNNFSISTKNREFDLNVESFLKVKQRILERTPHNSVIAVFIIRDVLWAMRWNMAKRNYLNAYQCLSLCLKYKKYLPLNVQVKIIRIKFFFNLFRILRKGDTRFNNLLKV